MKQILIPLAATALFIIIVGTFVNNPEKVLKNTEIETIREEKTVVTLKDKIAVEVDLAEDDRSRAKGLSKRESLEENEGMLFVIEDKSKAPVFWMKDMLIPIDIIWIENQEIIGIEKNVQPPKDETKDEDLERYSPEASVDYVLEVNAGFADNNNLKKGDSVLISQK